MKHNMTKFIAVLLTVGLLAGSGYAYGGRGHRLVWAISDRRLANTGHAAVKTRSEKLLDVMTLEEVATLRDGIKEWDPRKEDTTNPIRPREPFRVKGHPN